MQPRVFIGALIVAIMAAGVNATPPIELELATERGVQITTPHEWLQRLATIGLDHVRIRGTQAGDVPAVTNVGTSAQPRYHVVGILTARGQLNLPGGAFGRGDTDRLKDYFARLAADGSESLTAARGRYGLTEQELAVVFAGLTQSIGFETTGQPPRAMIDQLAKKLSMKLACDPEADQALNKAAAVAEEVQQLTVGTGLAIVLRNCDLVLRPEKPRGESVLLRISTADDALLSQDTLGRTEDVSQPFWPIGWEPDRRPRELAPSLFESLHAEIDGYTLEETLAAIGPRLGIPMFLDQAALVRSDIRPAAIKVTLPRTKTYYKRVLDRVLAQARLGAQVRIDEAGTPFLWITR
jgi:hypothetical protein